MDALKDTYECSESDKMFMNKKIENQKLESDSTQAGPGVGVMDSEGSHTQIMADGQGYEIPQNKECEGLGDGVRPEPISQEMDGQETKITMVMQPLGNVKLTRANSGEPRSSSASSRRELATDIVKERIGKLLNAMMLKVERDTDHPCPKPTD